MLTEAQLAMRRTGIGASEIGAVAGLSQHESPLSIYLRKLGLTPDVATNEAMEAGNELEGAICAWAAKKLRIDPLDLVESDTLRHPEHPYLFATPDRLFRDGHALIQAKNVGLHMAHGWGGESDDVPDCYRAQVVQEMAIANVPLAYLAVLIGGQNLRIYPIARDLKLEATLIGVGRRFWLEHVLAEKRPAIDASETTRAWLTSKHPKEIGKVVRVDETIAPIVARFDAASRGIKALDAEKDLAGNELRDVIGNDIGVCGSWGKATWKRCAGSPRWKEIALAAGATPELIAKHTDEGHRVLNVWPKGKKR